MQGRGTWVKRAPLAVEVAGVVILMVAFLPSVLHIPITGPNGQAEVAPVPGHNQTQSNFSQVGLSSSGTVGSGAASGEAGQGTPPSPPAYSVAQQADCIGTPPRQTEDPLSPPCVPYWSGDNGGNTWRGVTKDTINVALYSDVVSSTDGQSETTQRIQAADSPFTRTAKTLVKYFQSRFQTYGRTVNLIAQTQGGNNFDEAAAAQTTVQRDAFASVVLPYEYDDDQRRYVSTLAKNQITSFVGWYWLEGDEGNLYTRQFLEQNAPYAYHFGPEVDSEEASTAAWICKELVGHPAIHAGDPTLSSKTRKFGLLYDTRNSSSTGNVVDGTTLISDLKGTCGVDMGADAIGIDDYNSSQLQPALAKLQKDGVTSVILFVQPENTTRDADEAAPRYTPEWIFNGDNPDAAGSYGARANVQDQWADAFGVTWRWRAYTLPHSYWEQAYDSVNSDGQFDNSWGIGLYEGLLQLYSAIQMAGPDLTPSNVQSGFEKYKRYASDSNHSPSAWFTAGDYSFIKDMEMIRWSTTGTPPGGADDTEAGTSNGCWIEIDSGARYTADSWPSGDHTNDPGSCGVEWDRAGTYETSDNNT